MRHVGSDLGGSGAQIGSGIRANWRPQRVILRAENRSKWLDSKFEMTDFRLEKVDF